jgi:hypothetical protein
MKLELLHSELHIIPETIQDEVWLENVLKLKDGGDRAVCYRENASRLSCWAYATVKASPLDRKDS